MILNPYLAKKPAPQAQGKSIDDEARRRMMAIMPGTAPAKPPGATTVSPAAAGNVQRRIDDLSKPKTGVSGPGAGGPVSGRGGVGGVPGGAPPPGSAGGRINPDGSVTPGTPPPATSDSIDQMIRDRVARELAGKTPDTTAQEALIRQQQDAAIGSGAVNARARAGRGGFEASGAIMGIEGDIERQARAAATEQTLGVRDRARQERFDRQQSVIDSELALRDSASNDMINERLLGLLGMTDGDGVVVGSSPNGDDDGDGIASQAERDARVQQRLTSEGYDTNGDGTISDSERRVSTEQKMTAHQKFADLTPEQRAALPIVTVGGDWVALTSDDRSGKGKGMAYNKKTGAIALYNL